MILYCDKLPVVAALDDAAGVVIIVAFPGAAADVDLPLLLLAAQSHRTK